MNAGQVANFLSNPQTQNIFGRINGGNPSLINGLLQVTGGNSNLFLMNPAGIIFGQGASLNVPASFTATTANQIGFGNHQYFSAVGENNFSALVGNPNSFLFTTNQAGSIVNAGNLSVTSGQSISLIGGNIVNTGNINAGNITLAAVPGTNRVRISQPGYLLSLEVTPSADSAIAPLDLPRLLTGQSLPGISSNGTTVEVAGVTIPAGQGVNVTSGNLSLVSPLSVGERTGVRAINILGDRVALLGANLNASGVEGGGTIRVGGEYRGGGNNPFNSRITYVDAGSFLSADALNAGDGGRVIIWGDDVTRFYGNISARGGANGGNGGFAEVSGAQTLTFAGNADLSAPRGSFGTLLLDPVNIFINNGANALGGCALPTILASCNGGGDITISQTTLQALGAATNIVLEASNNITFGTLAGGSLDFFTCDTGTCGTILFSAGGAFDTNTNNINALGRSLTINAASITAGNIDTSIATVSRDGGNINLTATTGDISAGNVSSGSSLGLTGGNAGAGGNINILAPLGNIDIAGNVDSRSVVANVPFNNMTGVPLNPPPYISGNSSRAGDITIAAQSVNIGTPSNTSTGVVSAYSRVDLGTSGNGGNIVVRATNGSITARGMNTTAGTRSGTAGTAGNITIDATNDIIIFGAIIPQISPTNVFALDSRSLSVDGGKVGNPGNAGNGGIIQINQNPPTSNGIFRATGEINSSSMFTNPRLLTAIGNSGNGGAITITAQSISTNNINSSTDSSRGSSGVFGVSGNSGNGGSINLSSQGTLSIGDIDSSSSDGGTFYGNSGDINLSSQGTLSTGSIYFSASIGNSGTLNLSSQGNLSTGYIRGNGRDINLSSQGTLSTDGINIYANTGDINLSSQGALSTGGINLNSYDGNGGTLNLSSQGALSTDGIIAISYRAVNLSSQGTLSTGNIRFTSFSSNYGGAINLSSQGTLSTGNIDSFFFGEGSAGYGGAINLSSQGTLSTGNIRSYSGAASGTSRNGGDINILSQGTLSIGNISSFSVAFSSSTASGTSRNGGDINISSQGTLSIGDIFSSSTASGTSGNGGDINISSQGTLSIGDISSSSFGSLASGNGGVINLSSQGTLSTGFIDGQSSGGYGGSVNISAGNLFLASGSRTRGGGNSFTISTQGGLGGGLIDITHAGSTTVPFLVGNATNNGTSGAITSGTGANTINNLVVPVPPAVNPYGTNITIRTTAPDPISILIPLLTNPAPPSTPNPVIVGTPPILVVDPISVAPIINIPVITPSTGQITIVQPTINNPTVIVPPIINNPSVVVPPPSPTNPQLSRPILEANSPGAQSPISLAAANSSIPIIDRIPVDSQNNKIRLLDDPFKEEFQLFSGISDEIATLDVNQAQDILQRIIRETNTKPVFIYVFFAPENDTERTVNSARGLSSPLRVAQDTDILEVVLVPPTGDLVRVKYPGLKRPQVIETAQRFVSLTVNQSNGYIGSARQLHEWIITPLQEELKKREIDNLVFLMDVGLRSIPLAAMRDKNNSDRFIIEDYSVGLMPSLTLTDTSYTSLRGSEVLGMGAATFVGANPLPGVPLELNTINQLWGGNTLINENFTLSNLRQARRPAQRIVHLATHGVFASGEKSNSYIQLWGNERLTLDQIRQAGWGNPPVDLLVLSACQTALGDREAELGFAGLAVQAGVKSALASLWLVSDEGTLGLMTEFYKQLQETTTKSEALRLAQLAMLRGEVRLEGGNLVTPQGTFPLNEELRGLSDRTLQHPYFWSGFTMVGNPW